MSLTIFGEDEGINPELLDGIIDTGASVICVDSRVPKRLGLVASKRKPMKMADGRVSMATIYPARMSIPDLGFDNYVEIYGIEMDAINFVSRVLLGRSFLKDYIVNYDGPREQFQFHETERGSEFYSYDHDE